MLLPYIKQNLEPPGQLVIEPPAAQPEVQLLGGGNYNFLNPRGRRSQVEQEEEKQEAEQVIEEIAKTAPPMEQARQQLKQTLQDRDIAYQAEYGRQLARLIAEREAERRRRDDADVAFLLLH